MYDEFAGQRERWDAVNDLWSPRLTNTIGYMQRGMKFFVTLPLSWSIDGGVKVRNLVPRGGM